MAKKRRPEEKQKILDDRLKGLLEKYELVANSSGSKKAELLMRARVGPHDYILIRRPVVSVESLSEQEETVAVLCSMGLANQDIAKQMSLSVFTVANHMRKIFKKLGVKSRAAVGFHVFTR